MKMLVHETNTLSHLRFLRVRSRLALGPVPGLYMIGRVMLCVEVTVFAPGPFDAIVIIDDDASKCLGDGCASGGREELYESGCRKVD